MPRLQFTKGGWVEKTPPPATSNPLVDDTEKKELRQEIKYWWQAVAEHLDKVVGLSSLIPSGVPESSCRKPNSSMMLLLITKACLGYLPRMTLGLARRMKVKG
jgi:hypothetical protein